MKGESADEVLEDFSGLLRVVHFFPINLCHEKIGILNQRTVAIRLCEIVKGGNGIYDVRVNKTAAGAELYTLKYSCLNSAGKNTGTAIATIQNQ